MPKLEKLKPILNIFKKYRDAYIILIVLGGASAILQVGMLTSIKQILNHFEQAQIGMVLYKSVFIALIFFLLIETFRFWQRYLEESTLTKIFQDTQDALVEKITSTSMTQFVKQGRGDLMQRLMDDVNEVSEFVGKCASSFLKEPLKILIFGGILLYHSWVFGIIVLVLAVCGLGILKIFDSKVKKTYQSYYQKEGEMLDRLEQILRYFSFIKAYNLSKTFQTKWKEENKKYVAMTFHLNRINMIQDGIQNLFILTAFGLMLCSFVFNWNLFEISSGNIALILGATFFCLSGIRSVSSQWLKFRDSIGRVNRVAEVLNWRSEEAEQSKKSTHNGSIERLDLKGISFGYRPQKKILDNFNLRLEKGSVVSLVGQNGVGKSTLAYLLVRLFDPQKGELFINGKPSQEYHLEKLRHHVHLVFQDPLLLEASLKENLLFNTNGNGARKLKKALELVGLEKRLRTKNDPLSTDLGRFKQGLSFGERQKLALARAYISNPEVLVLDEATSSIDQKSEKKILKELLKQRKDKITLIITHNRDLLDLVDQCYELKNGKLSKKRI